MMQEECLVRGTPAMVAGIIESHYTRLWEDRQPGSVVDIVGWPLPVDTLDALLRVDSRRGFVDAGEPGSGYAWLRLEQEPDGVTRLSVDCDPADWEEFGLAVWQITRGELERRGLVIYVALVARPGPHTDTERKLNAWRGWEAATRHGQSQRAYCDQLDPPISPRTLRNWRDDLKREKIIS